MRAHEVALTAAAMRALAAVPGVTLYGSADATGRSGVVSFSVAGVHPHDIATSLDVVGGWVCVRARGTTAATAGAGAWGARVGAGFVLGVHTADDVTRPVAAVRGAQGRFAGG